VSFRRKNIWWSWPSRDDQSVVVTVLLGCRPSVWRGKALQGRCRDSSLSDFHTNIFVGLFFLCVAFRFFPYGVLQALLMVLMEVVTIYISFKFLSWLVLSLYSDFHGECSKDTREEILVWSGALQVPMILGAILGVWTEPWISYPLFRVTGALYGVLVLRNFLKSVMKFPSKSLRAIWMAGATAWIFLLIGARVIFLSLMSPVWVDALIG